VGAARLILTIQLLKIPVVLPIGEATQEFFLETARQRQTVRDRQLETDRDRQTDRDRLTDRDRQTDRRPAEAKLTIELVCFATWIEQGRGYREE
jgi:hypothetical protein